MDSTISNFLINNTIFTANHSWTYPGIYTLKAYAIDDKDVISEISELEILIDTIYCKDLGYLTDYTDDSIYDLFCSNSTSLETPVKLVNGLYLIDIDNNGGYDYQFNITTQELSLYSQVRETKEENWMHIINPYLPYIIIIVIVLLIVIIFLLIRETKQKPKKKVFYADEKDKIETKETKIKEIVTNIKDEKSKSFEEKIDELLSKKNN